MPRSTAIALQQAGHLATDVRDAGLRGYSDTQVFAHAQAVGAVLVTEDKDFANVLRFPLGSHAGVIVVRVPNELPTRQVNEVLLKALADLQDDDLKGSLIIVEAHRTRIRRSPGISH